MELLQKKPFQFYIQTIGRGQKHRRSLTIEEAKAAMQMILQGEVTPMQLGAFLMLIRVREETPEEAAGFLMAIRETLPQLECEVDIDWGSYAGKRRQLPWFLLALTLLAQHGKRILLHGIIGNEANRLYTQPLAEQLGWPVAKNLEAAKALIETQGFCYLSVESFAPKVAELMALRDELGLRSPIHTLARMLNPLQAKISVHGVFHKGYDDLHQQAAVHLPDPMTLAFCGDGGEAEVRPDRTTVVKQVVHQQDKAQLSELTLPKTFQSPDPTGKNLDPAHLMAVWQGKAPDEYGEATVIQTLTLILMAKQKQDFSSAHLKAKTLWNNRHNLSIVKNHNPP